MEDLDVGSFIIEVKVAEVVKKLNSSTNSEVDEIFSLVYQCSGCYRVVLADSPLQHYMDFRVGAS